MKATKGDRPKDRCSNDEVGIRLKSLWRVSLESLFLRDALHGWTLPLDQKQVRILQLMGKTFTAIWV